MADFLLCSSPLPVDSCQRCCSVTGSTELAGVALVQAELLKLGSELYWLPQRHLAFISGQEIRLFHASDIQP